MTLTSFRYLPQFSEDDRWYRARVKRASALKKECEVVFADCGWSSS